MATRRRNPLIRLTAQRLVVAFATLLLVSAAVFFGANALPGNAAQAALQSRATDPVALAAAEHQMGLDKPVLGRYFEWISGLLHGDLGNSLVNGLPVVQVISDRLLNSAVLGGFTFICLVPLAIGLGVWTALKQGTVLDHVLSGISLSFLAVPEFVSGTLLITIFATLLGILPAVSLLDTSMPAYMQLDLLVLPILTVLLIALAQSSRLVRASTIEVLHSDYIQMAILRGTPRSTMIFKHVLPNTLATTIQVFAFTIGSFAGGLVVVETVFAYPGIGVAFSQAVSARDVTTVSSIAMIISAVFIVANLLADLLVLYMNPKLRRAVA